MASGYWVSQVVYVAAKLGIADLLADAPKSCEEIAHETGTDCRALFRLMRSLVSLGILAMYPDQRFSLTEIGAPLQSRMPGSMRSMVLTLCDEHYQA
jgi:DNA-binding IclR family transcriptional regulator